MSWKAGLGMGMRGVADALMQWASLREGRQEKALDRALQERGRATQEKAQQAQADYYSGLMQDRQYDNELRDAQFVAQYYGGQEDVPQEVVKSIPERFRPVMVKQEERMVPGPAPAGLPGAPETMETLQTKTSIRQPVTAGERTASINAAARQQAEFLRQDYLTRKLAQEDKALQLADARAREALSARLQIAAQRVAVDYAGQDAAMQRAVFNAMADAEYERWKVENKPENPLVQFIMGGQGAQPGGGAPAAPKSVPPVPVPAPPRRRPVGGAPATADPTDPLGLGIRRPPR